MAWVPVPKEHHPLFLAALPRDAADIATMPMFGGIVVTVNGNIAGGLFGRSVMLRLNDSDAAAVLAMDGASSFDPMGRGMKQPGKVMLPEDMMSDRRALARWLDKAITRARALPPKRKGAKSAKPSAKPPQSPAKKRAASPSRAKKSAPSTRSKPAAKRTRAKQARS